MDTKTDTNKSCRGSKVPYEPTESSSSSNHSRQTSKSNSSHKEKTGSQVDNKDRSPYQPVAPPTVNQDQDDDLSSYNGFSSECGYVVSRFLSEDVSFPVGVDADTSTQDNIQSHTIFMKYYLDNFDVVFHQR
jgi:hypothetical protein